MVSGHAEREQFVTTTVEPAVAAVEHRDPRSFLDAIDPSIWDREVKLLVRDYPFDTVMAERLLAQAVAYLITAMETELSADDPGIGCGYLIDIAVHTLILDTANYREFCHRWNNGQFLDHIPEIERKADGSVKRTAELIERHGFRIDWPLWEKDYLQCTPCHPGHKH